MHLAQEAEIPPGVINVIAGSSEITGVSLVRHPELARTSFTGSPEVWRFVAESAIRTWCP